MNRTIAGPRGRIDWRAARESVDLAAVATRLMGPAPGRRGERGRRLWWPCPFHEDRNPSLCVEPGKPWWRCYGCGQRGDAAALVMRLNPGMSFPEAVRWLTGDGPTTASRPRSRAKFPATTSSPPNSKRREKPEVLE